MRAIPIASAALALTVALAGFADEPSKEAAWLKQHAIPIRTIDPADDDFADLMPLAAKIGTARVVALGEQSHGDGAAFLAKHRLVRFLHQKMGFNVLAWESGLFDCAQMDAAIINGAGGKDAADKGIFPIWGESQHVLPVFAYASESMKTGRRLKMAGFDCQFSSRSATEKYPAAVEAFFDRADPAWMCVHDRERLAWLVKRVGESEPEAKDQEVRAARAVVERLLKHIDTAGDVLARVHNRRDIGFMKRTLMNLLAFEEMQRQPKSNDASATNLRDRLMGENLAWLAKEYYPDHKIIAWAASFHLMRNAPTVKWVGKGGGYEKTVPMGHTAAELLGKDYYSVMFTASGGQAGNPFFKPRDLKPAAAGSLEKMFEQAGREYAFVDLRSPPAGGEWLAAEQVARPMGYTDMKASWPKVFDAVVYTKTMFPSTRDGQVPAGVLTAKAKSAGDDPVAAALEEYRKTVVGYGLNFDAVFPRTPWTAYDAKRLERFPSAGAWPDVLGRVEPNVELYKRIPAGGAAPKTASGGVALEGPLASELSSENSLTVICRSGVAAEGSITANGYTSLICTGPMAGRLFFGSYATCFIKGDLTGSLTSTSYFNAVITGKFTGKIETESYAMIYLLGGLGGEVHLGPSRLWIAGRTTKADLDRIKGTKGEVYLEESDLPAGQHKVNGLAVTVGKGG